MTRPSLKQKNKEFQEKVLSSTPKKEEKEKKGKLTVGPVLLGFFVFLVLGSTIVQILRTAIYGNGMY